jgi:DNA polymerase III delta prime subunit
LLRNWKGKRKNKREQLYEMKTKWGENKEAETMYEYQYDIETNNNKETIQRATEAEMNNGSQLLNNPTMRKSQSTIRTVLWTSFHKLWTSSSKWWSKSMVM